MSGSRFARKAVEQLMQKRTLSADKQRGLFARASTAKRFILTVLAPELLELRVRHDALEKLVIEHLEQEDAEERLKDLRKTAEDQLADDYKLRHLADPVVRDEVWKGVEKAMKKNVENIQRRELLRSAGVEDQK